VMNVGYSAPSCAMNVVDPTGCGNSFCGGFLAALLETNDIKKGLAIGSAAASIMLEHVGVPIGPLDSYRDEARARAAALRLESFTL
jgi:sugar/nucleoside kinase (ribokinase family)